MEHIGSYKTASHVRYLLVVTCALALALLGGRDARALDFAPNITFDPAANLSPQQQQQYQQATLDALKNFSTYFGPSNITLRIDITFKNLPPENGSITLGESSPSGFQQIDGLYYAQALYNYKTQTDLSGTVSTMDIRMNTSSDVQWFFGASTPPSGQSSFQDTIMHEVGHAMGFFDTVNQNGSYNQGGPSIFEQLTTVGVNGTPLSSIMDAGQRAAALTSNNLYWNGQFGLAANNNTPIKLFAPSEYQGGSTYSHIDPSQTTAGGIFFPEQKAGVYYPGPTAQELAIFRDLGWATTGAATPTPTATPSATPQPTPVNIQFVNISTRVVIGSADQVGIGGFILRGNLPKKVIVRAIGPSLKAKNVSNALSDPLLELRGEGGVLIAENDNWRTLQEREIGATGVAPTDDKEAAIIATLEPGKSYTAIIKGVGGTTGVGLIEVYDLNPNSGSDLANISTRGNVLTGENILIGGLIVQGGTPQAVVVRAIGPSLAAAGVQGVLQDPTLDVRDANGTSVMKNDNWQDDPNQAAALQQNKIAPTRPEESAIIANFPAGRYTALVEGKGGTTGVGLVEAYNIGPGNTTATRSSTMWIAGEDDSDQPEPDRHYIP